MPEPKGFLRHQRSEVPTRSVEERVTDYGEVTELPSPLQIVSQASRCLTCGVPFCQSDHGCPLGNRIPIWNELVRNGRLREAIEHLHATNCLPDVTGRVCPAPCETACVLGITEAPVSIRQIESSIAEQAWQAGLVQPRVPEQRTGKRVAVIGSGPSGLAAADQLNQAGHTVVLFERADRAGGLLTYGIPNFKLDRATAERRIHLFEQEGIEIRLSCEWGVDNDPAEARKEYDAVVLCGGSTVARELEIPGRELEGVYRAMDYLTRQNRVVARDPIVQDEPMSAKGKHVVVLGGGDTGADCIGTAVRQGAVSVTQLEILPRPPADRLEAAPWPWFPRMFKTSTSHEEAEALAEGTRLWQRSTLGFLGDDRGRVRALEVVSVEWEYDATGRPKPVEVPGSRQEIPADLVLLALGFTHPEHGGLLDQLGVELNERGLVRCDEHMMTTVPGVFAAGDMRRGASLVVWALAEGRDVAYEVDRWLMGDSALARATRP